MVAGQGFAIRHDRGRSGDPHGAAPVGGDEAKRRAGDAAVRHGLSGGREGGVTILFDHCHGPQAVRARARITKGRKKMAAKLSAPDRMKKPS